MERNGRELIIHDHERDLLCDHHDDVIKWKHFPRYWSFVRGIHRSPVNSPHNGQWRGALMFFFTCVWRNTWVNNREGGDLGHHRVHYDVIVMMVEWVDVPDKTGVTSKVAVPSTYLIIQGLYSQHRYIITCPVNCGMKLFIHSRTSTAVQLKLGNG